jgi:hypothetical protein
MPSYARIDLPGHQAIYITSREGVSDMGRFTDGLANVIDVTRYLHDDCHDWVRDKSRSALDTIADDIERELRRGGVVIIHCDRGRSRSPIAAGAYLIKHRHTGHEFAEQAIELAFRESNDLHGNLNRDRLHHQLLNYDIGTR